MRKLVMGCAVAGMIALSAKPEARDPVLHRPSSSMVRPIPIPKGEIGLASWYGIERQGKPTASGELFDKDRLTAAHRKLPLGTKVRVTNLKNLTSTVLRINDRGPGIQGRVIDVSWAAAKQLGFLEAGLARVEIDVISYPVGSIRRVTDSQAGKANQSKIRRESQQAKADRIWLTEPSVQGRSIKPTQAGLSWAQSDPQICGLEKPVAQTFKTRQNGLVIESRGMDLPYTMRGIHPSGSLWGGMLAAL